MLGEFKYLSQASKELCQYSNNLLDGIAFGSAARKIMQPLIEFAHKNNKKLYDYPEIMGLAIKKAQKFLEPWKSSSFK